MKPRAITDVSIKELSLIFSEHKGKEWEPVNQDAQVLMVKGSEVKPEDKKNIVLKALDTVKSYFMADYAPVEPAQFPVTQAEDNIDNDGDGPEDYNAIVSAVCALYGDLSQQFCVSDDASRSAGIVSAIDSFLAGLDKLRNGDDEKAGARHSKADAAHIAALSEMHAKMGEHIAALQPKQDDGKAAEVSEDEKAKDKKPYGDVEYADPENGKYPIDTEEHARAAWSYINQEKNAAEYSADKLKEVKDRIRAACKKFGIGISDDKAAPVEDEMKPEDVKAMIAEALAAKDAETEQKIAAAKAEAQAKIDEANAAAETAKAQAAEAKTAAQVQADLAEQYKAEAHERGEVIKAAAGLAAKPTASSATATGGQSRLSQVLKAQLAQTPMSHRF